MSLPVIEVSNLGKKFIIGHQKAERYATLRDTIAAQVKSFVGAGKNDAETKEDFWAVRNLDFNIEAGDRVGIIGRNGAGKSTLLKLLSRITEPTEGRIILRGRIASLLEVGTGFHPELTGRENIFLNGAILGMSRAEIRSKFDEIVAFAEVEKFLDTPVKRYSSGMYVRLAFAVAAHLEPEILIVDEVLAVGDAQFQKKCLGKMEEVSKNQGRTVLFVSHNMGVITQLCNKGILLKKGNIEIKGNVSDVVDRYISNADSLNGNVYLASKEESVGKPNYFKRISSTNRANEGTSDFSFDEPVRLNFDFIINEYSPNIIIGIGIQDKLQNRVSTIVKPISFFKRNGSEFTGSVELPASMIAPNLYSFVFVIWIRDSVVYDNVENVCPIKIHDNGTELAVYEGFDYGSVILNPKWSND